MFSAFFYPLKGCLFFISHPRLWIHLIKSIFISILLLVVIFAVAKNNYSLHIAHVPFLKKIVLSFALVVASAVSFFALNSIFTARFMKALSINVELLVLKKEIAQRKKSTLMQSIFGVFRSIRSIPFVLFIFFLNFVPIIGQVITFYFLGRSYASFPLDRRDYSSQESSRIARENSPRFVGFGIVAAFMMIPPFTIIAHPMCVVGGTLMTLQKIEHWDENGLKNFDNAG
ncbi:EI24 domain-containing protein [Candidatus Uabimicrobium sp. HlEnr_7]|uniref:EI24 domain-containing protein n=1 Tax=Candidatus Uabimicrobium helgolandensis TaxID=3095367 RepID=UPI0035572AA1